MSTFIWTPDGGMKTNKQPTFNTVKFGDGYEQRIPSGINNVKPNYNVSFSLLSQETFQAIDDFLSAVAATGEGFDWTPPGGAAGRFVCDEWSHTTDLVTYNISATFRRVFGI